MSWTNNWTDEPEVKPEPIKEESKKNLLNLVKEHLAKIKTETKIYVGIGILVLVAIFLFLSSHVISTGEVGVVSHFGKMEKIIQPGFYIINPITHSVDRMKVMEQVYEFKHDNKEFPALSVSTKDMQTISIDISVQASVSDPEKLYRAFKGQHEKSLIRPRIQEIVQTSVSKFTIEEFISKRSELSQMIAKDLKDDFERYGLVVSNISITDHDFSDSYDKAVEEKKVAEQSVEKAKAEAEKQQVEADNKLKLSEKAVKQKELESQANRKLSETLTPEILRKMEIENERAKVDKWNGVAPQVTGGNSIINLENKK